MSRTRPGRPRPAPRPISGCGAPPAAVCWNSPGPSRSTRSPAGCAWPSKSRAHSSASSSGKRSSAAACACSGASRAWTRPAPHCGAGRRRPPEPPVRRAEGSAEAGLAVLRLWLANAGVNPNDVELEDGSGLSRSDLVTPHAAVQLLKYVEAQPWRPLFVESLAVAGVDGTLEERMKEGPARGRVRAKTGSLGDTTTLAGYAQTTSGETLVFALFLNHRALEGKQALALVDELCAALAEQSSSTKAETRTAKTEKR